MPLAFLSIASMPHGLTAHTKSPATSSTHTRSTVADTASGASLDTVAATSSRISPERQSKRTMALGPRSTSAAASPAMAKTSPPPAPKPGTSAASSMPSRDTHHSSSPVATHAHRPGGPGCCTTSSLGSAEVGRLCHVPSAPTSTRRSVRSSRTGTLPSSDSSPSVVEAANRSVDVDVVRRRLPSTNDHTPPSGATTAASPTSTSNPTVSPPTGTTEPTSFDGSTTTNPTWPTPAMASPRPRVARLSGDPNRSSTGSIARVSAVASLIRNAPAAPWAIVSGSPGTSVSRLANGRPPYPSINTTRPDCWCTNHRVARAVAASTDSTPSLRTMTTTAPRTATNAVNAATTWRQDTVFGVIEPSRVRGASATSTADGVLRRRMTTRSTGVCGGAPRGGYRHDLRTP